MEDLLKLFDEETEFKNTARRTFIFDFSQMFHAVLWVNINKILIDLDFIVHNILQSLLKAKKILKIKLQEDDQIIIVFDSKGSETWRSEAFKLESKDSKEYKDQTYKGTREKDGRIDWNRIKEIQNDIYLFFKNATNWKSVINNQCEADDLIFSSVKLNQNNTIIGYDKDFEQIWDHDPNLKIFDYRRKIFRERTFPLDYHILIGDSGDNIQKVEAGIGPKKARKIIEEGVEDFLSADLNRQKRWDFNKKMIDFNEIPGYVLTRNEEILKEEQNNFDIFRITDFLQKYGCISLQSKIGIINT